MTVVGSWRNVFLCVVLLFPEDIAFRSTMILLKALLFISTNVEKPVAQSHVNGKGTQVE